VRCFRERGLPIVDEAKCTTEMNCGSALEHMVSYSSLRETLTREPQDESGIVEEAGCGARLGGAFSARGQPKPQSTAACAWWRLYRRLTTAAEDATQSSTDIIHQSYGAAA